MAEERRRKVILIGAKGYERVNESLLVDCLPWSQIRKLQNIRDYDVVILNLLSLTSNRRRGARPKTMRNMIFGASYLLKGKTTITSKNYRDVLSKATPTDLVYMDPPYQGVCRNRDTRYLTGVQFCEFVEAMEHLNRRNIRYIVSYDGRTGNKIYGKLLPSDLNLTHVEVHAGRSSQATLLGRNDVTVESLYLSPALTDNLAEAPFVYRYSKSEQMVLLEGRT